MSRLGEFDLGVLQPLCELELLIEQGALFQRVTKGNKLSAGRLTDQGVARIIKKLAGRAGLIASQYAGHSLRSGFLTSAAQQRASIFKMQA